MYSTLYLSFFVFGFGHVEDLLGTLLHPRPDVVTGVPENFEPSYGLPVYLWILRG